MSTNIAAAPAPKTKHLVLWALCISHLFNDTFQSLIPAAFPLLKSSLLLNFTQVGLIATVFQLSSSVCQPIIGWFMDKYPQRYSLPMGMTFTLIGVLLLADAWNFYIVLVAVAFIGIGSAVFHPESGRLALMASGGKLGLAQSIFQTGGNVGSSLGPLLAALVITHHGLKNIAWFALLAIVAILWMIPLSRWYGRRLKEQKLAPNSAKRGFVMPETVTLPKHTVYFAVFILLALVFSKNMYTASFSNFFTFYLMERYHVSVELSQYFLFAFLFATAIGTIIGGPVGDKIGRKPVIWFSILGAAPFALLLPYVHSLWATCALSMVVGAIMASSFPAILIFAQELMPGKVGTVGGLFFGFSFGAGAIASALLGGLADHGGGVMFVYNLCSYMPLIGLITWFLPTLTHAQTAGSTQGGA